MGGNRVYSLACGKAFFPFPRIRSKECGFVPFLLGLCFSYPDEELMCILQNRKPKTCLSMF